MHLASKLGRPNLIILPVMNGVASIHELGARGGNLFRCWPSLEMVYFLLHPTAASKPCSTLYRPN